MRQYVACEALDRLDIIGDAGDIHQNVVYAGVHDPLQALDVQGTSTRRPVQAPRSEVVSSSKMEPRGML